jgi:uracil-DNA glycosylase family 4
VILERRVPSDGPEDADIVVVATVPEWDDLTSGRPLTGFSGRLLFGELLRAGLQRSRIRTELICQTMPQARKFWELPEAEQNAWKADCLDRVRALSPKLIVLLGEEPLRLFTDKQSIDKWHLSVLETTHGVRTVPLLSPERIVKQYKEIPFLIWGAQRVAEEVRNPKPLPRRNLIVDPTFEEALAYLERCHSAEWLGVDIETGRGQITCCAFSPDPSEAMSIPLLQDRWTKEQYWALWQQIRRVLEGPAKKVFQNGIYDTTYFNRYGIVVRYAHDTMYCQKFLNPEMPMGLDTQARLFTREPYWKDEAKDWGTRQDIRQLWTYNAKDACVMLEIAYAQFVDLKQRNLEAKFKSLVMDLVPAAQDMSWAGLPVDEAERTRLRDEAEAEVAQNLIVINAEAERLLGEPINVRSPQQVKKLLKASGMKLGVKKGKETSDVPSLLALSLKHPKSPILRPLIKVSERNKQVSSYLTYMYDQDGRVRYSLGACNTETGRWNCTLDPWGRGFNVQTIPSDLKGQFYAEEGFFFQVDLRQADGRVVAWDSADPKLMEFFRTGRDVHKYVASNLFSVPEDQITKDQRQLGKKSGHAANYGVGPNTFAKSALVEMDLVMSVGEAQRLLSGYLGLFEGIPGWHRWIEEEVRRTKRLTTPMGRERYFYDRIGPDLFREAYAYRPQSTVLDVINCLVKHMHGHVQVLAQVHDSLLMWVPTEAALREAVARVRDEDAWNPILSLRGGEMRIPVEGEWGKRLSDLEKVPGL